MIKDMASNPPHSLNDFTKDGLTRRFETETGTHIEQWIEFDEPTDDGSGDGPYRSTSIDPQFLRHLG